VALAAIAISETGQVTYLLWVCPALAIGFGARAVAVLVVLVGAAVARSVARSGQPSLHAVLQVALPITLAFLAASAVRRLQAANQEVARAREQLAVAAVQEERARFAPRPARPPRPLADCARRQDSACAEVAVRSAATELADAEHLTRAVLDDVRQAVEGYREPHAGRPDRGCEGCPRRLRHCIRSGGRRRSAGGARGARSGSVRPDAITNVPRHSGASRCVLTLGRDETAAGPIFETAAEEERRSPAGASRGYESGRTAWEAA
jgi:two-component system, NarL family, sensor histidine kinase DesK